MKYILISLSIIILAAIVAITYLLIDINTKDKSNEYDYLNKPHSDNSLNFSKIEKDTLYKVERILTNIQSENGRRILKIDMVFEVSDKDLKDTLDLKSLIIRDKIIRTLNISNIDYLLTNKGKAKLKEKLIISFNNSLSEHYIKDIYFSKFVIQ